MVHIHYGCIYHTYRFQLNTQNKTLKHALREIHDS